jgi:hypothetical protein
VYANRFDVIVSGCNAKISVAYTHNGNSVEMDFDENTIYRHAFYESNDLTTNAVNTATIEEAGIPVDDGSTINYLWLAYASECYWALRDDNRAHPIWLLRGSSLRNTGFTIPATWSLSAASPRLPEKIIYLNEGLQWSNAGASGPDFPRYAPPFAQGFTNAVFERLSTTNLAMLSLPSEFTFTRYAAAGSKLLVDVKIHGRASAASLLATRPRFKPEVTAKVDVADMRFSKDKRPIPVLRYATSNAVWQEKEALVSLATKARLKTATASRRKSRSSAVSLLIFGALLLGPMVWLYTQRGKPH